MLDFHLARFSLDVSPPLGHPLCGGWIKPTEVVDDPLLLRGVTILGAGLPIVLAAIDWTGVLNESHRAWTEAIAEAVKTTPDRVALHSVHQHNAPFIDRTGNALLNEANAPVLLYKEAFVANCIERSSAAIRTSLTTAVPFQRIQYGRAEVHQVASNRRLLGPDGKVKYVRYSATKDPVIQAEPEGLIDPILKSIAFVGKDRPLARLYYYTTHPMSFYGDGRVTSDFVGLARARRDAEEPETPHVYFTGGAGNITAGKYNTGTPEDRVALTDRVHQGMILADRDSEKWTHPCDRIDWKTLPISFKPKADLDLDRLKATVFNAGETTVSRNRGAMAYSWLKRCESKRPILLSRLSVGPVDLVHLPAETFVEYQLQTQAHDPARFVATAAYGDGGPWYIPLQKSFAEGGYEPSAAFVAEDTETMYRKTIDELMA